MSEDSDFPHIRLPKELKKALREEANERAQSRGRKTMSIAEYLAERRSEWAAAEQDPEEEEL